VRTKSCLSVLVVDDDRLFREIFVDFIASRYPGVVVAEAEDLAEARRKIREQRPHVALIDVCLPDGKGFALVEELRSEPKEVTIALCTSYDVAEYRDAAAQAGATCFISKADMKPERIAEIVAAGLRHLDAKEEEAVLA
jgi:DNA-binding NarL/FixJ family response regulator